MFSLLLSLMQPAYAQDKVLVYEVYSTQSLTFDFETVYRKNLEAALMNSLDRDAYKVLGSVNLIPEMEKTQDINKCVTANCEINMAKALSAKYVVTSEYTVLEGQHHLAIVLSDASTNAMVVSQLEVCPDTSCILSVNPSKITAHLNRLSFKPHVAVAPTPIKSEFTLPELPDLPEPETVGSIALAAAVVAPVIYLFADNISNISQK